MGWGEVGEGGAGGIGLFVVDVDGGVEVEQEIPQRVL